MSGFGKREYQVVGKRVPRTDAVEKATGEAKYIHDLDFSGMLCGKILRSPYPHARIRSIDVSAARRVPGVRAVITARDTPRIKFGIFPGLEDKLILEEEKVRYVGDDVAAVAAVNEEAADEALRLIGVEYEALPAVFDVEEALRPEAPRIHGPESNVAFHLRRNFGDVEEGFRRAHRIFSDRYVTSAVSPCCGEPRGCVARMDRSGRITLWATNQNPFPLRQEIGRVLGIPGGRVRVIQTHVGGAFGSRIGMDPIEPICILLAILTGKPVRILFSREEEFVAGRMRHPMILELKTGVDREGLLTAREVKVLCNNGAYSSHGPRVLSVAGIMPSQLYRVSNLRFEGRLVYTNNPYGGAFQGYGNPQGHFALESHMDMIARELGQDPIDFRIKNLVHSGYVSASGGVITSCAIRECVEQAAKAAQWGTEPDRKAGRGRGIALMVHGSGAKGMYGNCNFSDAALKINEDGSVDLLAGAIDLGQGSDTILAQIAAEEIGCRFEDVRPALTDTDLTPMCIGTMATRLTLIAGNAVKMAAAEAKAKLLRIAAELLEANPEDLESSAGKIWVRGAPGKAISISEVAGRAHYQKGTTLTGQGHYEPETFLDPRTGYGNYTIAYPFAAQVAEVEVDVETGRVEVLNIVAAHDLGRAINPMAAEGQVEGAVVKGIGYALTEELVWRKGETVNPSYRDYKVPTPLDLPPLSVILVESDDPHGPFGAKGVAEPGLVPTAPAIANALFDAVGVRIRELPITAEKVLQELKGKRNRDEPGLLRAHQK